MTELTEEARLLRYYRHNWDRWAEDHLDIELARYRDRAVLESWLERQPIERHVWCRQRLAAGQLCLDSSRSYQREILQKMSEPGWYVFRTANGIAKTATAAIAVLAFLDLYAQSRVLTAAGTWSQLQEQLWREIPMWAGRAKKPIVVANRIGKTQINLDADWAAFGRGADKAETFEGVHAPNLMVLVDEAKAVPSEILENAVRRIMRSAEGSKIWFLVLSSPGSPVGTFYEMCTGKLAHRFQQFKLSAYESSRITLEQLEKDAEDLGEESPLFISMNLGEFPEEGEDTVIPMSWVTAAVNRNVAGGPRTLGVDVARFGTDMTSLVSMFGRRVDVSATYNGKDTTWTTGKIKELCRRNKYEKIGIDDTGLGGGVTDQCRAAKLPVVPVNFGASDKVRQPERYVNAKAEMYFWLRKEFEAGFKDPGNPEVGLSIPNHPQLIHQLASQKYEFDARQRYRLESHSDMRSRGEKSPDLADALALANYVRPTFAGAFHKFLKVNGEDAVVKGLAAQLIEQEW